MKVEQTEISRKLGISVNAVRRIAEATKLPFTLINNKRCYEWNQFIEAIQRGKK